MIFDTIDDEVDYIMHIGTSLASGRFPRGSGEEPYQHNATGFFARVKEFKDKGYSQKEIAELMGMTSTAFKAQYAIEANALKRHNIELCRKLRDKGMSPTAIAERTGIPRTTVNGYLKGPAERRASILRNTADALKSEVDAGGYIIVSSGSEQYLGVSATRMKNAVKLLEDEGYSVKQVRVKNLFDNNTRTVTMLCPPGTDQREAWEHRFDARPPGYFSDDFGETYKAPPKGKDFKQFDSSKVMVRYAEEGGLERDGVIELRRGVDGLSLGGANYAQVRIGVDGTHYLKGMAVYADDLPEGIDIRFNTNKHIGTPMMGTDKDNTVLKKQKDDPNNPFGAQIQLVTARGYGEYINIVNEEGEWATWSKNLASQFLSKQPVSTAKKQLQLAYEESLDEYNEICSLTNPVIKRKLLQEFGDECDSKAVHLKAAAFPRQSTHVILPVESLSEKEIFAPRYENGEEVICVRYPHGGIFEIPRLRVNNKNKEALKTIGNDSPDAVGINAKTAAVLSGADFDGDTVLVIPTKNLKIRTKEPLAGLKDFDPKEQYPKYEGMKIMKESGKGREMGKITNLITDMTIKGATDEELERAVKFSMVVIDAPKHELDWKRAEKDLRINELRDIYQPSPEGSKSHPASTLISRAKNPLYVTNRKQAYNYDAETGEKIFIDQPKVRKDYKTGKLVETQTKITQMENTKDAYTLSSGYDVENVYANYANRMKALGNTARKEYMSTPHLKYNPDAKVKYEKEVASLKSKLNTAEKNRPLETTALLLAKQEVTAVLKDDPSIRDDKDAYKKLRATALNNARYVIGAKKKAVEFTDKEWEAVQAGAISESFLTKLIMNTKSEDLKRYALPQQSSSIPDYILSKAKRYRDSGITWNEIADKLGYSESALIRAISPSK